MEIPMSFSRKAALALTGIVAMAMPLAEAGSASGATTRGGCTVTPLTPTLDHTDSSGQKWIKYEDKVYCDGGRSIEILDERLEYDALSYDDYYGSYTYNLSFDTAGTQYVSVLQVLPDADGLFDKNEEMYHQTGFQVTYDNGSVSGWTPDWDASPRATFHL